LDEANNFLRNSGGLKRLNKQKIATSNEGGIFPNTEKKGKEIKT